MCISNHGKAGSESESQDRQRLILETYRVGSRYPVPGFIHTQRYQKPTVLPSQELICGFNLASFRSL
jgi:hypothetical protein